MMIRTVTAVFVLLALVACERSPTNPTTRVRVGQHLSLNASATGDPCANPDTRVGRVVAITERAIVVADTANPAGGFSDAEYAEFGQIFDSRVWPLGVRNFGQPSDIDRNGRIVLFFTRAVNELSSPGSGAVVTGFFFSRDLFPRSARRGSTCATSNEAEVLYMMVPDPNGIAGERRSREVVQRTTPAVLAHEFQHLINAAQRMYVNRAESFEEIWLNEGLSHIAEELMFFQESALAPRQNLGPAQVSTPAREEQLRAHQAQNLERKLRYLRAPEQNTLADTLAGPDELATRGAIWSFLRYAADRREGGESAFWTSLVSTTTTGVANLRQALGTDPVEWIRDWTVAIYTDDAVPGVPARYSHPSWNFRTVIPQLQSSGGQYPLRTHSLNQAPFSGSIRPLSAAYLRFGAGADRVVELRVDGVGGGCAAGASNLQLAVGEVRTLTGAAAGSACIAGGPEGSEYVVIPFNSAETGNRQTTVAAVGAIAVVGPPRPALEPVQEPLAPTTRTGDTLRRDEDFERDLRERERRFLSPGGRAPRAPDRGLEALLQTAPAEALRITIVRTR